MSTPVKLPPLPPSEAFERRAGYCLPTPVWEAVCREMRTYARAALAAQGVPADLMTVVEHILEDGHLNTQMLGQLRAAWGGSHASQGAAGRPRSRHGLHQSGQRCHAKPDRRHVHRAAHLARRGPQQRGGLRRVRQHSGRGGLLRQVLRDLSAPAPQSALTDEQIEEAYKHLWRTRPEGFDFTGYAWVRLALQYAEQRANHAPILVDLGDVDLAALVPTSGVIVANPPAPAFKPLERSQVWHIMTKHYPLDSLLRENVDAFEACVRDVEKELGIGAAPKETGNA